MTQPIDRIRNILTQQSVLRHRVVQHKDAPGPDLYHAKQALRQFHADFQNELTWLVAEVLVDQGVRAL